MSEVLAIIIEVTLAIAIVAVLLAADHVVMTRLANSRGPAGAGRVRDAPRLLTGDGKMRAIGVVRDGARVSAQEYSAKTGTLKLRGGAGAVALDGRERSKPRKPAEWTVIKGLRDAGA